MNEGHFPAQFEFFSEIGENMDILMEYKRFHLSSSKNYLYPPYQSHKNIYSITNYMTGHITIYLGLITIYIPLSITQQYI